MSIGSKGVLESVWSSIQIQFAWGEIAVGLRSWSAPLELSRTSRKSSKLIVTNSIVVVLQIIPKLRLLLLRWFPEIVPKMSRCFLCPWKCIISWISSVLDCCRWTGAGLLRLGWWRYLGWQGLRSFWQVVPANHESFFTCVQNTKWISRLF